MHIYFGRRKNSIISWIIFYITRQILFLISFDIAQILPIIILLPPTDPTWPTCQSSSSIFSIRTNFPSVEKVERFPRFARIARLGISFLPLDRSFLEIKGASLTIHKYYNLPVQIQRVSSQTARSLVSLWSRIIEISLSIRFPTSFGYRPCACICAWKSWD